MYVTNHLISNTHTLLGTLGEMERKYELHKNKVLLLKSSQNEFININKLYIN